jgi:hypothetical protein
MDVLKSYLIRRQRVLRRSGTGRRFSLTGAETGVDAFYSVLRNRRNVFIVHTLRP